MSYEGWKNKATYLAALYLGQDSGIYQKVGELLRRGTLNARTLAGLVTKVVLDKSEEGGGLHNGILTIDTWAGNTDIDWQDIADVMERDREITPEPISSELQQLLTEAQVDGNIVRYARQLDRKQYLLVDDALQCLGGKWDKKAKGHVFDEDPAELIESVIETGTFARPKKADNFGFFPTPSNLVREMLRRAGVTPGSRVLEPNGGDGAIAEMAAEIVGHGNVVTVELQEKNAAILREKGFEPVVGDFLAFDTDERFDFVLMNPPFAKQADIDHVNHAFTFLKPGGRLVAIMAASILFRDNAKTQAFREFLEAHGGEVVENPAGSFKESGTAVNTVTVVVNKPAVAAVAVQVQQTVESIQNFWLEDEPLAA